MTTTTAPTQINSVEDAETSAWLAQTLEPARARLREAPTADAIDRIRARLFGEPERRKKDRSIAA